MDGDIVDCTIETANGCKLNVTEIQKKHVRVAGIYIIYNKVNKKCYVGQSNNMRKRQRKHIYELKSNTHNNNYLTNSYNKYGLDTFVFYVVQTVDNVCLLNDLELNYIKLLDSRMSDFGYNLTLNTFSRDGENLTKDHGKRVSKQKIPIVQLSLDGVLLKKFDSATYAAKECGFQQSGISRNCRKEQGSAFGYIWIYESEYTKEDFNFDEYYNGLPLVTKRKFLEKGIQYRENREVYQFTPDGVLVSTYKNVFQTQEHGFSRSQVYKCCNGVLPKYKGFIWKFKLNI